MNGPPSELAKPRRRTREFRHHGPLGGYTKIKVPAQAGHFYSAVLRAILARSAEVASIRLPFPADGVTIPSLSDDV